MKIKKSNLKVISRCAIKFLTELEKSLEFKTDSAILATAKKLRDACEAGEEVEVVE